MLHFIADVDPGCAGPGAGDGRVIVDVDSKWKVSELIDRLHATGAVKGAVKLLWRDGYLTPHDHLCDVGLCTETTAFVQPMPAGEVRALSLALYSAAAQQDYSTASNLLAEGADPNWIEVEHGSLAPLHLAALNGDLELAGLLLHKGADIELKG
eukprot:Hpha_TRINITY_DN217_c0_g1::TRINITY_DN217_c0_g1_i1::g.83723::m.83723